MNSRKDSSYIALATLPGHSRFARLVRVRDVDYLSGNTLLFFALVLALKKPVEIGKERLRLNIIAIDHARFDFKFFTRQILEILTDRTTKVATKLSAFTKSLHFQSTGIVVGADFERQERQESFRAWAASKGMFTDSYSYWQRTIDTWTVRFWNLDRPNHKTTKATKPRKYAKKNILLRNAKKRLHFQSRVVERLGLVCFLEQRDFDDPGIDDVMNGERFQISGTRRDGSRTWRFFVLTT